MSKASNGFEAAISSYIETEISNDSALSEAVKKEDKSLADCCSFIINKVKSMGVNAVADSEVFALAKAYYLDQKITKVKKVSCNVIVGGAEKPVQDKAKKKEAKSDVVNNNQMSIFDLLES